LAFEIDLTSSSSPEAVVAAIARDMHEWRESAIPDELRDKGIVQVEGRVHERGFKLYYVRRAFWGEYDFFELTGSVENTVGGGCQVRARCGKARGLHTILIVLAGLACAVWLSGGRAGAAVLLGMAAVVLLVRTVQDRAVTRSNDAEARYLAERLEQAVARAARPITIEAPAG
jgi:hypothetical protein